MCFFWISSFFRALYTWWGHSNPWHHYRSSINAGNESCAALTFLCQPRLDGWTTELLPNPTSSDSFSACRVLDFSFQCCTLCCAKPVQSYLCFPLTAHLPVLQSKLSCCIHNLWASYSLTLQIWYTKLANQTFRAKSCSVWKSVWKLCQNQQRSSSLGPGHCFLQGASNQGQISVSC